MPTAPELSPPEFSSLIISRPRSRARILIRARGLALAAALYVSGLAALILAPLLVLESVNPPRAGIDPNEPPIRFYFRQPRGGGDNGRAGEARQGERNGRRDTRHADASRPARARAITRPADAAIPPPESELATTATPVGGNEGQGGPRGVPDGTGNDPDGVIDSDCPDCHSKGPEGPGDPDAPFEAGTPGLVPPSLLPGTCALPGYPDLARRAGLQGTVILLAVVQADGTVGEIEVVKNPDQRWGFDLAAIAAVKMWRYRPALMNGRPVAAYIQVMVEFSLAR